MRYSCLCQGLLAMPGVAVPFPVCMPADAQPGVADDSVRGCVGGYSIGIPFGERMPERYAPTQRQSEHNLTCGAVMLHTGLAYIQAQTFDVRCLGLLVHD